MDILVIFEEIPDNTSLFLFKDVDHGERRDTLLECHGHFINSIDEGTIPSRVKKFLVKLSEGIFDDNKIYSLEVDPLRPISHFDGRIVVAGFLL